MQTQSTAGIFQPPAHRKGEVEEGSQHTELPGWCGTLQKAASEGWAFPRRDPDGKRTHVLRQQHSLSSLRTHWRWALHLGPPPTRQLEAWSQDTFLPWRWKRKLGCGIFASSPNKRFVSSVKKIVHLSPCDKIISYPLQFHPPFHQPPPSFCKNLKSRCPPRLPASISPDPDGL